MKWDALLASLGDQALFDLPTVVQLSGEPRSQVRVQLSRWMGAGRLLSLRRGLYALGDLYRKAALSPLQVANQIYYPSYLSLEWALSLYGLLPDAVPVYQSVTTRVTRRFGNALGSFTYASVKPGLFWGFVTRTLDGVEVSMAEPEKALLDYWYLTPGEWTQARLGEMRLQQVELLDRDRLDAYAQRWESPRLRRTVARWRRLAEQETGEQPV